MKTNGTLRLFEQIAIAFNKKCFSLFVRSILVISFSILGTYFTHIVSFYCEINITVKHTIRPFCGSSRFQNTYCKLHSRKMLGNQEEGLIVCCPRLPQEIAPRLFSFPYSSVPTNFCYKTHLRLIIRLTSAVRSKRNKSAFRRFVF